MIDISVSGLVKEFEVGTRILDGLTFQIDQGERVGLLGKNGAGKTTFLKILTGELDYDEGEVAVAPGKTMGLISQIPVYPPEYTVDDVLRTAFERLHRMEREMAELTERMAHDSDPAILSRYDKLTAAFEAGAATTPRPSWARSAMACSSPGRCAGSFSPPSPAGKRPG